MWGGVQNQFCSSGFSRSNFVKAFFVQATPMTLGCCIAMFVKKPGRPGKVLLRTVVGSVTASILVVSGSANALFGSFMPLNLSGSLQYSYGYFSGGGAESETTTLTGTLNAAGYIWQPWFATTSAALNLGLSNTETTTRSSDSTSTSGSFDQVLPTIRSAD
jgi:hypothetical protein